MHHTLNNSESLAYFMLYGGSVLVIIIGIILWICSKWQTSPHKVIHHRQVLEVCTENGEEIEVIYECRNCGREQHGSPPCEMCGYDKMKPCKSIQNG